MTMCSMAIDFAAEGLLEGAPDERARQARLELLRTLESEGFGLEELRRAASEGRLALLPVERVLEAEGRVTRWRSWPMRPGWAGVHGRSAAGRGAPAVEPDQRVLTEEDRELAFGAAALMATGSTRSASSSSRA